jgi:hypothetical protein
MSRPQSYARRTRILWRDLPHGGAFHTGVLRIRQLPELRRRVIAAAECEGEEYAAHARWRR